MNRRREDFQNMDPSVWPEVDVNALTAVQKLAFLQSRKSVQLFVSGTTVREIEKQTGLDRRQLYRLLERCLKQADDGRLFGFRGLLKHHRVGSYTRTVQ